MPARKVASDSSERSPLLGEQNGSHVQNVDAEQAPASAQEDETETTEVVHEMYAKMHILVPALAIGLLLSALDQLITVASYAKMGNDLNALNSVGWVATSYVSSHEGMNAS
ncbi:hypothetical protein Golomagni_07929 [Golovinomyces magnicellulatus]|nr:hypothetical protein Golomagni_07929 [Golovinomyces magnicellulatus]